jgi:aryl sulfotransferase
LRSAEKLVRSYVFDSAAWDNFPVRPDDIVISTYPKCGTTWTQRLVGMMVYQSAAPFPVQESSPWPDFRIIPYTEMLTNAMSQTHRRYLKSHLPYDALPIYEGVKYIHVARDGRDAAMSFHHHKRNMTDEVMSIIDAIGLTDPKFGKPQPRAKPDPAAHFHDWVTGFEDGMGDDGASYFYVENSFWAVRREPNVLLVHFNDLKANLDGEMRRISTFLDIPVDEAIWPEIVKAGDFSSMKKSADQLMPGAGMIFKGGGNTFLNKGTNNRWKDLVDPADLALFDTKVKAEFSPSLAAWAEHGRLKAGDPATLPD